MITIYSDAHERHSALVEPAGDGYEPSPECPERALDVIRAVREAGLGEIVKPDSFPMHRLTAVHTPEYVEFLETAWRQWAAAGTPGSNARAHTFGRGERHPGVPQDIHGRLGFFAFDDSAPFVQGSWVAMREAADVALTGAHLLRTGTQQVFAACRPPGHHASADCAGGYCYLNNSAIAAQALRDAGVERVAVLDVDYHHGNGTQSIFYTRNDVLTVSLHADPSHEYPYFFGYANETGDGAGHGFNVNYPLPLGTTWQPYAAALDDALAQLRRFAPQALVVALGLDTFALDPTTTFGLQTADYREMGRKIATLGLPSLTVLEGGYAVDYIGRNTVEFLRGIAGN